MQWYLPKFGTYEWVNYEGSDDLSMAELWTLLRMNSEKWNFDSVIVINDTEFMIEFSRWPTTRQSVVHFKRMPKEM